jgi:hypothetical protein
MPNKKPKMGVFLALTFGDAIYSNYPGINADLKHTPINNLIITLREDGYFGFLGGTADEGETELQALMRECKEEGNVDLADLIAEAYMATGSPIDRVCEHTLPDGFKVILYHIRITKQIAKKVIRNSVDAEHFFTETAGLNSVAIHSKSSFAKNAFLSCMREEFVEIGKIIRSEILQEWGTPS